MRIGIIGLAGIAACAALSAEGLGNGMIVVLAGPPGSGKTTQAEMLRKEFKIPFVSAAVAIKKQQGWRKRSKALSDAAAAGSLLSDEATAELVIEYIKRQDYRKGFVLDGFPATLGQAAALEKFASQMQLAPPVTVVLDVPDEIARQRMSGRKRADDTSANIETRLSEYRAEMKALREAYPEARVVRVDATKPEREVYREIKRVLKAGE